MQEERETKRIYNQTKTLCLLGKGKLDYTRIYKLYVYLYNFG